MMLSGRPWYYYNAVNLLTGKLQTELTILEYMALGLGTLLNRPSDSGEAVGLHTSHRDIILLRTHT